MFEDLRSFIEACRKADDVREIRGAHWDLAPFSWRAQFPKSSRSDVSLRRKMIARYKGILPFKI